MTDTSREALIKKLRNIFNNEWVGDAVREAADMLDADKREPLWIDPNDKTQAQYLPHIGEKILFCCDGHVYYGKHTGGSFQSGQGVTANYFPTWDCRWMHLPAAHSMGVKP